MKACKASAAGGAAPARRGQVRRAVGVGGGEAEAAGRWRRRAPPLEQNGGDRHQEVDPVWKELAQR